MYRFRHVYGRTALRTRNLAMLGGALGLAACSVGVGQPQPGSESVGSTSADLLSTACAMDSKGDVTLTVKAGEVAYVGYQSSTVAATNAVTSTGDACTVAAGKTITVNGQGGTPASPEKLILDNSIGNLDLWPIVVALDTAVGLVSSIEIQGQTGAANDMALGASGIVLDATAARTPAVSAPDVKVSWSNAKVPGSVTFNGGPLGNRFVGDVNGLSASPPSYFAWASMATLNKGAGAAFPGSLTVNGGAGNDVLAGGAGANSLNGLAGDDVFFEGTVSHPEAMSGGDGFDTVDYSLRSATQPVSVTLNVDGAVTSALIVSGGSTSPSYAKGDVLKLTPTATSGVAPATLTVTSVTAGVITGASISAAGTGWAPSSTAYKTTGGSSAAQDATFEVLANGVGSVTATTGGTGYVVGDTLTLEGTGAVNATATVSAVTKGAVTGVTVTVQGGGTSAGTGFSNASFSECASNVLAAGCYTTTSVAGTGAVFAITALSSADDGVANEGDSVGGNAANGVSDVENVIGGAGNDTLDARIITQNDVALQGNAGNDTLRGGAGRDDLCGGPGSDILYWSASTGGSGNNTNVAHGAVGDFLSGLGGAGGGMAGASDVDTINYTTAGAAITACLSPAGCLSQNGAASEVEVINNTKLEACPGSRPFWIAKASSFAVYTPGMTAASKSIESVTAVPSAAGSGYAAGDLISINGGGTKSPAIIKVRDVSAGTQYTTANGSNSATLASSGNGSAPNVTVTGTPTYQSGVNVITITCTTGGTIGTAQFTVTETQGGAVNGGAAYTSSNTMGGSYIIALGSTGLTATFPAGTYNDGTGSDTVDVYTETTYNTGIAAGSVLHGDLIQAGGGYTVANPMATTAITGSGAGATFTAVLALTGDYAAYDQTVVGATQAEETADITAITGDSSHANTLTCGAAACTLVGGSAADVLTGSTAADTIFGNGGADTVTTGGGNDLVDLTNTGGSTAYKLTCTNTTDKAVVLYNNNGSTVAVWNGTNFTADVVPTDACTAGDSCSCQDATFLSE